MKNKHKEPEKKYYFNIDSLLKEKDKYYNIEIGERHRGRTYSLETRGYYEK